MKIQWQVKGRASLLCLWALVDGPTSLWHRFQLLPPDCGPERRWRHVAGIAKASREVGGIGETALGCDQAHGAVGLHQHLARPAKPQLQHIGADGHAGAALEDPLQLTLRYARKLVTLDQAAA